MIDIDKLNFEKCNGLIPAIIIDADTKQVLMLGFMNKEAIIKTIAEKKVTFFSRTKKRLWTKGETSGNYLILKGIKADCDSDTLLIEVQPLGNTCHLNTYTCFGEDKKEGLEFLNYLFDLIEKRKIEMPENSYTTSLFKRGSDRIIQKVGEEAIETVIAAKNRNKKEIVYEVSDLFFHLLVMLSEQGVKLEEIIKSLKQRHK